MAQQSVERPTPSSEAIPQPAAVEPVVAEPISDTTPAAVEPAVVMPTEPAQPAQSTQPTQTAPATPSAPSSTYFTSAPAQARAGKGFWRGSPAEIVFATLTAFALIAAFMLSVTHVSAPASATSGSNSNSSSSSSNNSSGPAFPAPAHKTYDATAPAALQGSVVNVKLEVKDSLISIAPGVAYHAWTFGGTVPGPIIRVKQGQTINFTLVNGTAMAHSIDFHAAETPWNVNYQAVAAGKSFSFTWKANYPGIFMYHCGTPPVIEHIANGMYGAIIVDPASGWKPAHEFVLVQSEFYTRKMPDGSMSFDYNKAMAVQPDYVTFNGYVNQYKEAPLTAKLGERVRIFVLNAGPSEFSAFHTIGAMFTDVYTDGNPANHMVGNQTITIPPGGGSVVELTIPEAGLYPFVTHSFANASAGALGILKIEA
ncbi:MAG TPA: multicopper oxidase domain-containing protein [Ktedonobacterales bacterium]|nr:multicopper oxidase domain-containing protein [Ktedonobacterales bacterium]